MRDLYGQLIDGMQATRGQIRSGGDASAELQGSPPTQPPVTLYSGIVRVGPDGRAEVAFDIPEFAGTVRLMAVAWSKDKVGHGTADVTVRDPVVLTATLPRFVLSGDRTAMQLDLDNVEGAAGDYRVSVAADGPVQLGATASQALRLGAHERNRLAVPLTASGTGIANLKVDIAGPGNFSLQRNYALAAKPANRTLTRRTVRTIAAGESLTLSGDMFADLVPGTGSVAVSVGPSTALDVATLLKALDRYPFGCSEQIASRALPLLYVNELAAESQLALDTGVDQRIRDAIDRLLARQGSNGAFGLWSVGGDDAWLDAYVTDFLTRARERGFAVPDTAFKLALDRLRNFVSNAAEPAKNGGRDLSYALYVLARNGVAPVGDLRYIADTKLGDIATPIAKAQLAGALGLLGDQVRAERVYAAALAALAPPPRFETGREDYGSSLRDAAAVVMLAAEGGAPAATIATAVDRVETAREQAQSTSTQENAWMVLAARAIAKQARLSLDVGGEKTAEPALPQRPRRRACRFAARHRQHRRCAGARGGVGCRCAGSAGAGNGEGLQAREALFHARRQAREPCQSEPESAVCGRSQNHRIHSPIWPHYSCGLSPGGVRDRQSTLGVVGRYRHAGLDRECRRTGVLRIPRRSLRRSVRPDKQVADGVHRRICGSRGVPGHLCAATGVRGGHVSSGSFRPHRHGNDRSFGRTLTPMGSGRMPPTGGEVGALGRREGGTTTDWGVRSSPSPAPPVRHLHDCAFKGAGR